MNRFCKQYIRQVKTLFPVIGKKERDYLRKLTLLLEEYCTEHTVTSLDTLYSGYDRPENVVNEYFSSMDSEDIILHVRKTKFIKALILLLVIASLSVTTAAATKTILYHKAYQETLKSLNGHWEETIY